MLRDNVVLNAGRNNVWQLGIQWKKQSAIVVTLSQSDFVVVYLTAFRCVSGYTWTRHFLFLNKKWKHFLRRVVFWVVKLFSLPKNERMSLNLKPKSRAPKLN